MEEIVFYTTWFMLGVLCGIIGSIVVTVTLYITVKMVGE